MEKGQPTVTVAPHFTPARDDDDTGGRDVVIPQPRITLNREAIDRWLSTIHAPIAVVRRCALCERPVATIEWRPRHPGWTRLCMLHRMQIHEYAARTSIRTDGIYERVLDAIMRALKLVEPDY